MAAENTPFIDSLSVDRKIVVANKSKGNNRPSYYDAVVAGRQTKAATTPGLGGAGAGALAAAGREGMVQISLDLEAALILTGSKVKEGMLNFIQTALEVVTNSNENDFVLMEEVLALRRKTYEQVFLNVGQAVTEYDSVRASFLADVDKNARTTPTSGAGAATTIVLADIGPLFASLSDARTTLSRPDDLAVHDRIADAANVYTFQDAATHRTKELSSWVLVLQTYLI